MLVVSKRKYALKKINNLLKGKCNLCQVNDPIENKDKEVSFLYVVIIGFRRRML